MGNRQAWATTAFEAVRMAWAIRSRRWWSRWPRLPTPDRTYLAWRSSTAYGDPDTPLDRADVSSFLKWRKEFRRYVRSAR